MSSRGPSVHLSRVYEVRERGSDTKVLAISAVTKYCWRSILSSVFYPPVFHSFTLLSVSLLVHLFGCRRWSDPEGSGMTRDLVGSPCSLQLRALGRHRTRVTATRSPMIRVIPVCPAQTKVSESQRMTRNPPTTPAGHTVDGHLTPCLPATSSLILFVWGRTQMPIFSQPW